MEVTFGSFAGRLARLCGSSRTFAAALFIVIGWALLGPIFDYSEAWQLVINTGTTIVT